MTRLFCRLCIHMQKEKINNEIDESFAAYSGYTSHMVNIVDKMKKY